MFIVYRKSGRPIAAQSHLEDKVEVLIQADITLRDLAKERVAGMSEIFGIYIETLTFRPSVP